MPGYKSRASDVKRERKKSFLFEEISQFLHQLSIDESEIANVFISRVDLSADTGVCYIYLSSHTLPSMTDREVFDKALDKLKLYKPSLRSCLAKVLKSRYVPDLMFLFDEKRDKVNKINDLLDKVQQERLDPTKE